MVSHMTIVIGVLTLAVAWAIGLIEGELFSWGSGEHGRARLHNLEAAMMGTSLGWLFGILLPIDEGYAPMFVVFSSIYGGIVYLLVRITISKKSAA